MSWSKRTLVCPGVVNAAVLNHIEDGCIALRHGESYPALYAEAQSPATTIAIPADGYLHTIVFNDQTPINYGNGFRSPDMTTLIFPNPGYYAVGVNLIFNIPVLEAPVITVLYEGVLNTFQSYEYCGGRGLDGNLSEIRRMHISKRFTLKAEAGDWLKVHVQTTSDIELDSFDGYGVQTNSKPHIAAYFLRAL